MRDTYRQTDETNAETWDYMESMALAYAENCVVCDVATEITIQRYPTSYKRTKRYADNLSSAKYFHGMLSAVCHVMQKFSPYRYDELETAALDYARDEIIGR